MKTIFHSAAERGHAQHGWLNAHHSFSFAGYYDPHKVHFGLLRVLNDDVIAPSMGFGMHPHDNMEIVTILLKGSLEHKDDMGNIGVIKPNEIQAMSAGSGVMHSEYNPSKTEEANLLQIWVFPKEKEIKPRYEQLKLKEDEMNEKFNTMVSPKKSDGVMWINQDAFFSIGNFNTTKSASYKIQHTNNGAYVFVIEGECEINSIKLNKRDAIGIWDTSVFHIENMKDAKILIIDVPMV